MPRIYATIGLSLTIILCSKILHLSQLLHPYNQRRNYQSLQKKLVSYSKRQVSTLTVLIHARYIGGTDIQTNGKNLIGSKD